MSTQSPIPVTLVGGYLGSGKTTLVNHLLRHAAPKRLAILVNEFGELPIDADLIEAQEGDVISLSGGCVCCSYGNDLLSAVMDVCKLPNRPDHIVLEASGVALPRAIASSLSLLSSVTLDGVVVLADAETVLKRSTDKYMADTVLRQLADADIVLLNKTDLVNEGLRQRTRDWLAETCEGASLVETQHSVAPISVVLQDYEREYLAPDSEAKAHDTSAFSTYRLDVENPVDPALFAQDLIEKTTGIVRAKGFLRDLQGGLQTLQIVGKRYSLTPSTVSAPCAVVVITVRAAAAEESLRV